MKKLLLLSTFASFCLSANPAQEALKVLIFRPFKTFGIGAKSNWSQRVKIITLSISDFSDETTIAELKKKIALKAGISMKKLNGNALLSDNWGFEEYENSKTCQYYNLSEKKGYIQLMLPSNNVAADFLRSIAVLPRAAIFAIAHKCVSFGDAISLFVSGP